MRLDVRLAVKDREPEDANVAYGSGAVIGLAPDSGPSTVAP